MESDGKDGLQEQLVDQVIANLRRVFDPEIHLNVYDLGLIYGVQVNQEYDFVEFSFY